MATKTILLPDSSEPGATVRSYIEAFNGGDTETMSKMCADPMSILDGMAPHVWHGPTAAADWYRDAMTEGEHLGAAKYNVALGEATHDNITGAAAYVVFPATMTFKPQGKQITQTGAFFTIALRKLGDGWRISSWAWTKGSAQVSP